MNINHRNILFERSLCKICILETVKKNYFASLEKSAFLKSFLNFARETSPPYSHVYMLNILSHDCSHISDRYRLVIPCKSGWLTDWSVAVASNIAFTTCSLAIESYFCCRRNVTQIMRNLTRARLRLRRENVIPESSVSEKKGNIVGYI